MPKEKMRFNETVIAVLRNKDGGNKVIRERWYHKFLWRIKCKK